MFEYSLFKSKILNNISKLTIGNGMAELVSVASIPVISRIYSPAELGIFMFFFSVSDVIANIVTGKFDLAIVISKNKDEALVLLSSSIFFSFLNSIILICLILILSDYFIDIFGLVGVLKYDLIFLALMVISFNFYKSMDHWANFNKEYTVMAKAKFFQKILLFVLQVLLSFFGFIGLVLGRVISQFFSFLQILFTIKNSINFNLIKSFNFKTYSTILNKHSHFPKYVLPSTISNKISYNLPNITFSKLFDLDITGFYSMSYRLIASPMGIIMSAIGQVFYREASEIYINDKSKLYVFTLNFYKNLFLVGVIPFIILFFVSPGLFTFILGEKWSLSGKFIQILIPWLFLVYLNSSLTSVLIIINKQKQLFIFEFISMILRFSAIVISWSFFSDSIYTVVSYGFVGFCVSIFLLLYILNSLKNCK